MRQITRTIRSIVPSVLVGLQALALVSCEPAKPLLVQQPFSADSTNPSAYVSQYGVHYITITTTDSSLTTGQQVQATAIPRNYYGDALTQAPVTWSIAPANVATISATGLITGGSTSGTATVSATSDGITRSMTITVTATSSSGAPVHMVSITANATTLKIGEVTQVSGIVRDINGNPIPNVPIIWSTSPVTVATATTTTASAGTVTGAGVGTATLYAKADTVTRQITITVVDSASTTSATPTTAVPSGASGASYGSATAAELPRATVNTAYPTAARQVRVAAGASLQAAIDAAQPGDELLLAPGATYAGNFYLRNKGALNGWITIRTDVSDATIGAAGTRMTPSRASAANLARIVTPNIYSALTTEIGANHYRFTGVEIGVDPSVTDMNALVRLGDNTTAQNSAATTAGFLIFDRTYIHGNPSGQLKRCVMMNSASTAVVDSWLGDCHSNVSDSQAIVGWNGPGPFLIQNDHLEAGHEVIMFGGGGVTTQGVSPSDITIRGNHIMRPASWKGVWQVKNLIESKHSLRILIEGNVIENTWADAQAGYAFVMKSENQQWDTPWTTTSDVTIRYNRIRNVGSVFNLASNPSGAPCIPAARFVITDNVVENVNVGAYAGDGRLFQMLPGMSDVVVMHNTMVSANGGNSSTMYFAAPTIARLVVHSNVLHHGGYGVKGDAQTEGTVSLNYFASGSLFSNNAVVAGGSASTYPTSNYFPSTLSSLGFVDVTNGDYRLSASSSYVGKGYDGRDIGADIAQVNNQTKGAVVAP